MCFFDRENVIAVYTDTTHHEGWWYEGAGIYRNVWLVKTDSVAVDLWGVYVKPQKVEEGWMLTVETTVRNDGWKDETIRMMVSLKGAQNRPGMQDEEGIQNGQPIWKSWCLQKIKPS